MSDGAFRRRALGTALRHVRRALPLEHASDLDVIIEDCDTEGFSQQMIAAKGEVDHLRWRVDGDDLPAGELPQLARDDRIVSMLGVIDGLSFELFLRADHEERTFGGDLVYRGGDLGPSAEDALHRWLELIWTLAPLLSCRQARLESIGEGGGVVVWQRPPG